MKAKTFQKIREIVKENQELKSSIEEIKSNFLKQTRIRENRISSLEEELGNYKETIHNFKETWIINK